MRSREGGHLQREGNQQHYARHHGGIDRVLSNTAEHLFADDDGDHASMVMRLKNHMDCIGCQACSRVCPKDCLSHAAATAA